ncbi:hypothetical protein K6119_16295 [Paracrocinitomix mangrovi]|uniref:hypothetical protein n=1 Tax=Paracrocinitomix mangrovi TaxID=2862509 RepID=UPI001C8D4D3C|nr:hypothetical protein [Paracrocinitomix mangrovi]UKN01289.1 hypothetical protein K6119_16295 [Paracrocinitomix mangrovi]
MKKILFVMLFMAGISVTMSSCKKANLTRDQWKIANATDLQDNTNITADYAGEIWEYSKNGDYIENGSKKGVWAWGDGKNKLIITENDGSIDTYNVIKIKKNEMEIELPGDENLQLERIQ